jgi:hypothetical protein
LEVGPRVVASRSSAVYVVDLEGSAGLLGGAAAFVTAGVRSSAFDVLGADAAPFDVVAALVGGASVLVDLSSMGGAVAAGDELGA